MALISPSGFPPRDFTISLGSSALTRPTAGCVMAMGNFDGVHRGHRALLSRLVTEAAFLGRPALVYTFHPLPQALLRPLDRLPRILSLEDRVRFLGEAGVNHVVVERFSMAFSHHPASWFVREVIGNRLQPSFLLAGYDFHFGRGGEGTLDLVRASRPDLRVEATEAVVLGDGIVSSSRVREAVRHGRVEEAAVLLGRPHFLRGTVVRGYQRGRTLGFPTINLETDAELLPAPGVYATRSRLDGGPLMDGVTAVGVRPTFGDLPLSIETFLFEPPVDPVGRELYGEEFEVGFESWLRAEQKFDGVESLVAAMGHDVELARLRLAEGGR